MTPEAYDSENFIHMGPKEALASEIMRSILYHKQQFSVYIVASFYLHLMYKLVTTQYTCSGKLARVFTGLIDHLMSILMEDLEVSLHIKSSSNHYRKKM